MDRLASRVCLTMNVTGAESLPDGLSRVSVGPRYSEVMGETRRIARLIGLGQDSLRWGRCRQSVLRVRHVL